MDAAAWVGLRSGQVTEVHRITSPGSRFWQATVMADYYETLAADYDWIFDDDALSHGLAINHPGMARLLERTSNGSTVLDAACGTGVNAAALARRGYRVWAADGSAAMVAVAAARFRSEQLEIPVVQCMWADLPDVVGERFDVVLCIGNSLVHAAGRDAMIGALTGLREMARPGGHVVVDSRNWEKLHAEHRIVQLADSAVTRHGRKCIVLYAWEIPDRLDQEHVAHIVLIFEDGSRLEPREYRIGFHPFTVGDLRERLEAAGLKEVDTDFDDARDRYAIIAVPA
jgi:2-polyprenyl-3-methyl-5-hydroxy-6-metoxy-1,4-benzoquinol methylase